MQARALVHVLRLLSPVCACDPGLSTICRGISSCASCHAGVARSIQTKTGFTASEVFRKFLWYLLRERKFDSEAVNDVVQLKASLQLSDAEVSQVK